MIEALLDNVNPEFRIDDIFVQSQAHMKKYDKVMELTSTCTRVFPPLCDMVLPQTDGDHELAIDSVSPRVTRQYFADQMKRIEETNATTVGEPHICALM